MTDRNVTFTVSGVPAYLTDAHLESIVARAIRANLHPVHVPVVTATSEHRAHPFDGPEVFDDSPANETIAEYSISDVDAPGSSVWEQLEKAVAGDFPFLAEVFRDKREGGPVTVVKLDGGIVRRPADAPIPEAEGDWALSTESNVGTD